MNRIDTPPTELLKKIATALTLDGSPAAEEVLAKVHIKLKKHMSVREYTAFTKELEEMK